MTNDGYRTAAALLCVPNLTTHEHEQLREQQSLSWHLGTQEWAQVSVPEH